MGDEMAARAAVEVFEDHMRLGQQGTVEEDLVRNYADDVVALTADGVHRGHDGVRELAKLLDRQLPDATFTYTAQVIAGEVGFLEWTARAADGTRVEDGADSFVIRDGRIRAQTIHYTVKPAPGHDPDSGRRCER